MYNGDIGFKQLVDELGGLAAYEQVTACVNSPTECTLTSQQKAALLAYGEASARLSQTIGGGDQSDIALNYAALNVSLLDCIAFGEFIPTTEKRMLEFIAATTGKYSAISIES